MRSCRFIPSPLDGSGTTLGRGVPTRHDRVRYDSHSCRPLPACENARERTDFAGEPRDTDSSSGGLDEGLKRRTRKIPREGLQELRKARRTESTPLQARRQGGPVSRRRLSAPCDQCRLVIVLGSRNLNRDRPFHPFLIGLPPQQVNETTEGDGIRDDRMCALRHISGQVTGPACSTQQYF